MPYVEVLAGLVLLVAGGDALVRGAVSLARRLGVSPMLIGLTLVGFGTSTPELLTSVQAALAGSPGIAIGNVVGSNTANILLILGIGVLLQPMATTRAAFYRDGSVMLGAALLCCALALWGEIGRPAGVVLVALLAAYIVATYLHDRRTHDAAAQLHEAEAELAGKAPSRPLPALLLAVGGLAVTLLGAHLLVSGSVVLAQRMGVSDTVIGLTVVAVGTSLPELVATVSAALRRQTDLAFGNVVGSNIYNVLGILGVTALVEPLAIPPEVARVDVWVMLAATLLLLAFAVTGWRLCRREGAVLLACYAGYVGWLAATA
jgi:cation:H+ antiporter